MSPRVSRYLNSAKECRRLAIVAATADDRKELLEMAAAWEDLAQEHEARDHRPQLVRAMDET